MGYSIDLRIKVMRFLEKGGSIRRAAATFGISPGTVNNWQQMLKQTGDLGKRMRSSYVRKLDPEKLKEHVEKYPDAYLSEIAEVFGCSNVAVFKAFRRLKITRKKPKDSESKGQSR